MTNEVPVAIRSADREQPPEPPIYRPDDPLWWEFGAICRGTHPRLFYPDNVRDLKAAQSICAICPVRLPCGEYGIRHEAYGTWGGLSESERVRIRRERGITVRHPSVGSPGGYRNARRT